MHRSAYVGVLVLTLVAPAAEAQPAPSVSGGPVAVSAAIGIANGSPGSGAALGGRLAYDVTDRVGLEATGSWLQHGAGADGATFLGSVLFNMLPGSRHVVPYAAIGAGIYRASFDLDNDRFFGRVNTQFLPGTQMVPLSGMRGFGMMQNYAGYGPWMGTWTGPTWDAGQMPMFYQRRMGLMQVPMDGHWGMRSFTDPAFSLGGGVRINVTPHFSLRPDVRAIMVRTRGDSYTTGMFTLGLDYRF
jgi:opacity protein-like surface antigen